jgi:hypothetical protein
LTLLMSDKLGLPITVGDEPPAAETKEEEMVG